MHLPGTYTAVVPHLCFYRTRGGLKAVGCLHHERTVAQLLFFRWTRPAWGRGGTLAFSLCPAASTLVCCPAIIDGLRNVFQEKYFGGFRVYIQQQKWYIIAYICARAIKFCFFTEISRGKKTFLPSFCIFKWLYVFYQYHFFFSRVLLDVVRQNVPPGALE